MDPMPDWTAQKDQVKASFADIAELAGALHEKLEERKLPTPVIESCLVEFICGCFNSHEQ